MLVVISTLNYCFIAYLSKNNSEKLLVFELRNEHEDKKMTNMYNEYLSLS